MEISKQQQAELLTLLRIRFEKNIHRHPQLDWNTIQTKLESKPDVLSVLYKMEQSDGEPDVIGYDQKSDQYIFCDCSPESPKARRSVCYDNEALASRKEHKPRSSALQMAQEIGIELLDENQYRELQKLEAFDTKTSSWIKTPDNIRELGGALFGDCRYKTVFIYHNGAESYYSVRGFRGFIKV